MIITAVKHYLYDLALNIFFDAVNNNFVDGFNILGKKVILTHIDNGKSYAIIVTAINPEGYSNGTITGTLEDAWGVPEDEYIEDLGQEYNFDLKYFNMVLL